MDRAYACPWHCFATSKLRAYLQQGALWSAAVTSTASLDSEPCAAARETASFQRTRVARRGAQTPNSSACCSSRISSSSLSALRPLRACTRQGHGLLEHLKLKPGLLCPLDGFGARQRRAAAIRACMPPRIDCLQRRYPCRGGAIE